MHQADILRRRFGTSLEDMYLWTTHTHTHTQRLAGSFQHSPTHRSSRGVFLRTPKTLKGEIIEHHNIASLMEHVSRYTMLYAVKPVPESKGHDRGYGSIFVMKHNKSQKNPGKDSKNIFGPLPGRKSGVQIVHRILMWSLIACAQRVGTGTREVLLPNSYPSR